MPLTVNGKEIGTATRNGAALDKVTVNTSNVVWENWVYKTGNLVKMTSNSAPSPFTASYYKNGGTTTNSAYNAFDNTSTSFLVDYPNADAVYVQLNFGSAIKIGEFTYNMTASGQSTYSNYVKGIKADGSTVTLKSNTTCSGTVTVSDGNEYIGIRFGCTGRTDLIFKFTELQITKWWQKGS